MSYYLTSELGGSMFGTLGFGRVEVSRQNPQHPPASDNWAFPMVPDLPEEGSDLIYPPLSEDPPGL